MLKWKENPRDEKSFKAHLSDSSYFDQKSAGASIKLKQLTEEEPIFNLTLIEFLQQDYEIG